MADETFPDKSDQWDVPPMSPGLKHADMGSAVVDLTNLEVRQVLGPIDRDARIDNSGDSNG